MNTIHGFWRPEDNTGFIQSGTFFIWVEHNENPKKKQPGIHPQHLQNETLANFLKQDLAITTAQKDDLSLQTITLPGDQNRPLPCPEPGMDNTDDEVRLTGWQVHCYPIQYPLKEINNIHFLSCYQAATNTRIGPDFLFWYYFSQSLKEILYKDRYVVALITHKKGRTTELYRNWKILSSQYESLIRQAVSQIPLTCHLGYDPETLLRHFAEVCIDKILDSALDDLPKLFHKRIQEDILADILIPHNRLKPIYKTAKRSLPMMFAKYFQWQQKLFENEQFQNLQLGLQLHEAPADQADSWQLTFFLSSLQDPSLKWPLADFWRHDKKEQNFLNKQFGTDIERRVLLQLAHAAKIYPKLWQSMTTRTPSSIHLNRVEAADFLQEQAWILQDSGFQINIPAHLTPKGRQRAKLRLQSRNTSSGQTSGKTYLSLDKLVDYHYELAINGQPVSEEEWQQLIAAKSSLVQFRGQWVQLDQAKMQELLNLWKQQQDVEKQWSIQELLKKLAEAEEDLELADNDWLAVVLSRLNDNQKLQPIDNPAGLKAQLRDYQKRGVAWIRYLEKLGLNGCLADDMGLGKTMQVIANLVLEKEANESSGATLLIAPTSVLGNWQKEVEKFAPHLTTLIHHGANREKKADKFAVMCRQYDLLITSYTLIRKDAILFKKQIWHRIVLDEAQNIKNPKTAQTKAILTLQTTHRLALTGTPVENRLMDLWSVFNFLNPGYLGKQTRFRKQYEIPIQRNNDAKQSAILKKLIQPLVLRRVKTDKSIIKDLPDKIENKQYCNLSKEQASLYEAVVQEVNRDIENAEGIARQGLMLSTLLKLKQICNHPMQFLHDDSPFTPERSHKLERLTEMLAEAFADGDSVLIFTQFTEIGEQLENYLKHDKHYPSYYLHGGTSRNKRERMINQFQDPDTPPAAFILSLKAGGVGITLTRANHVFHFDRWWNPAVENQATDRAFRIGQKKNVFVHKFITLGTLEERIDQMIEDKQKMADAIIGNDESWLTSLDNQAFRALIALNKNSVLAD